MPTAIEIRQTFLDFFRQKGHAIVPSAPIVVKDDPTLMFTNAGMNQFKDYFLGHRSPADRRVADTQKCLRVSGKHNDLEEVGLDTYHHTMFEMLGNWSFGDYFKAEAIPWSWELLTGVYGMDPERLYVTVFGGDDADGLPADAEALACWQQLLPADRILYGSRKDNFWEMGDTGPCGPCSEIHMDCRPDGERAAVPGRDLVNTGDPRVIEIWNLVFMEFNRLKDGSLQPLPARHVDTGMGLERLVRCLQGKASNYDTDLFQPVIRATEALVGHAYGGGDTEQDVAFRVIADHLRAVSFAIADGQLPANTGAGYVLRRILRRAVRYYFSFLGIREPLLCRLTDALAATFGGVFPELEAQGEFIRKVIREEENGFLRTLDSGMKRIDDYVQAHPGGGKIDGATAFELYDTYGFPLDLTLLIGREKGFGVDEQGFAREMKKQKSRSRAATELDLGDWTVLEEGAGRFVGYERLRAETRILRYRQVKAKGKSHYQVVLAETPFYAESGGQVGDTGRLLFGTEEVMVKDTRKENELIVHLTDRLPEPVPARVLAEVDAARRERVAADHTATHLLHAALRRVLGTHVQQKGSLVHPDYLRFDFSHFSKLSAAEIGAVEALVNEKIRANLPVVTEVLPREQALQRGAMALFGEKYGDTVRMVTADPSYSVELCGGTHVGATGELGFFKITSESAVAAGVRRIEAVAGAGAEAYVRTRLELLDELRARLKNPADALRSLAELQEERSALEKKVRQLQDRQLQGQAAALAATAQPADGAAFVGAVVQAESAEALKQLAGMLTARLEHAVVVLAADIGGKAAVVLALDEETASARSFDAAACVKERLAPLIAGGGGGQRNFATAGGRDSSRLDEVVATVRALFG